MLFGSTVIAGMLTLLITTQHKTAKAASETKALQELAAILPKGCINIASRTQFVLGEQNPDDTIVCTILQTIPG